MHLSTPLITFMLKGCCLRCNIIVHSFTFMIAKRCPCYHFKCLVLGQPVAKSRLKLQKWVYCCIALTASLAMTWLIWHNFVYHLLTLITSNCRHFEEYKSCMIAWWDGKMMCNITDYISCDYNIMMHHPAHSQQHSDKNIRLLANKRLVMNNWNWDSKINSSWQNSTVLITRHIYRFEGNWTSEL